MRPVEIYLSDDLVIYRGLQKGGALAMCFKVTPADYRNAEIGWLNELEADLRVLLASLREGMRLQVHWTVNSDYQKELLAYRAETERLAVNPWTRRQREERFARYWKRMEERTLRRESLHLWFSSRVDEGAAPRGTGRALAYQYMIDAARREFLQCGELLEQLFGAQGGSVEQLDGPALYTEFYKYFNPSSVENPDLRPGEAYDPLEEIGWQCLNGEAAPVERPDHGFYLDGYYHNTLAFKTLPRSTFQGMMERLTDLRMLDYSITVNITPLSVEREIAKEESEFEKLNHALTDNNKLRMVFAMEKKRAKIQRLTSNRMLPFNAQFILRVWDKTREGLSAKISALKSAAGKLNNTQVYEAALPVTARNYFLAAVPGWAWDRYSDFTHYIDDCNLANLLPFSSTATGDLDGAEALYDGPNYELIGVRTFDGGSPAHALAFGSSGSGKSVLFFDLATQAECYYRDGFTLIVDFGNSWGVFGQTVDPRSGPIAVQPNGNLTFNYLDTGGLPLTGSHLVNATALCQLLMGKPESADIARLREAHVMNMVRELYTEQYESWRRCHPEKAAEAARRALGAARWRDKKMTAGASWLDAWVDMRDAAGHGREEEVTEFLNLLDEGETVRYARDPETAEQNMRAAFAFMARGDMPVHGQLTEKFLMESFGRSAEHEHYRVIARLLEPWAAGGMYGSILDGESTVRFDGRIAHFELGLIPDSARELLNVAAFLIACQGMNEILTRPRSVRKRVILEEMGAFLQIPNAERITADFYERARKYNTWVLGIIQNYRRFAQFKVSETVTGNAKQVFMLRQSDRGDLDAVCAPFPLPEVTRQTIMRFPDASRVKTDPWGGFVYYKTRERRPQIVTGRNYSSPEMLYASSSSGENYEARQRELKGRASVTEAIIEHANA